jgi:hypothetical protein
MGFSPVLQHFRSLLLSLAWGGVQSRSSDGNRDIDAVVVITGIKRPHFRR